MCIQPHYQPTLYLYFRRKYIYIYILNYNYKDIIVTVIRLSIDLFWHIISRLVNVFQQEACCAGCLGVEGAGQGHEQHGISTFFKFYQAVMLQSADWRSDLHSNDTTTMMHRSLQKRNYTIFFFRCLVPYVQLNESSVL